MNFEYTNQFMTHIYYYLCKINYSFLFLLYLFSGCSYKEANIVLNYQWFTNHAEQLVRRYRPASPPRRDQSPKRSRPASPPLASAERQAAAAAAAAVYQNCLFVSRYARAPISHRSAPLGGRRLLGRSLSVSPAPTRSLRRHTFSVSLARGKHRNSPLSPGAVLRLYSA